jgi:hypothetical protein
MQDMKPAKQAGFYLQTTRVKSIIQELPDNFHGHPHCDGSAQADFMV